MVGNDVSEDMITEQLGMKIFLLTDCFINKGGRDIAIYPHGSYKERITYINSLDETKGVGLRRLYHFSTIVELELKNG